MTSATNIHITINETSALSSNVNQFGCTGLPNNFFKHNGSCYDNEKFLYQKMVSEAFNQNGVKADYYVVDYSTNNEKIYGEDNDRHILRNFVVKVYFDLPPEIRQYNQFGMEDMDNFQMWITKTTFSNYSGGYDPKYGDFIRPHYNSVLYEIIDVIDTDEQFLNTQHTWKLTVRVWVNNMLTASNNVSAEHNPNYDDEYVELISAHLTSAGSDFLKQNDLIDDEFDDIEYKPLDGNNNPFGDW